VDKIVCKEKINAGGSMICINCKTDTAYATGGTLAKELTETNYKCDGCGIRWTERANSYEIWRPSITIDNAVDEKGDSKTIDIDAIARRLDKVEASFERLDNIILNMVVNPYIKARDADLTGPG